MVQIIESSDLPSAVQAGESVALMVAGANATAARVAPCLVKPTTVWAASTTYAEDAKIVLSTGEVLQVSTGGASAASEPVAPLLGETVVDGTVTWTRITPTEDTLAEAKLILVGAIVRWSEAGSGDVQQKTAGPFGISVDTRQGSTGYRLRPSEIEDLQALCKTNETGGGLQAVDTVASCSAHSPVCGIYFNAPCSCGASLAGFPLYEDVDC